MTKLIADRRQVLALAAAAIASPAFAAPTGRASLIVELRQYTLHAGQWPVMTALFEREFLTTQADVGIEVIGQFRDLDDPNRFVWMRGFPDMPARAQALGAFYGGPVWKAGRDAANATIVDSDNVLLLRPLGPDGGFDRARPAPRRPGLVVVEIRYLDRAALPAFAAFYAAHMAPRMAAAGATPLATFVTEESANNFPRLPIRENVTVLASALGFADVAAHRAYQAALAAGPDWREAAGDALLPQFMRKPEILRLEPAPHSHLRG
jgi:hypothetical protein